MTTMHEIEFAYEVAEEVVFRLGEGAHDAAVWSIGEIVERAVSDGRPHYVVRFRAGDEARTAIVGQDAIEGTA